MTTKVQGDMYDIDGATVATVAAADKINFFDVTDSLVKEDTVQGILDLAGGGAWNLIGTQVGDNSGTTLTITGLSSTYDTYAIGLSDLVPASDGVGAWLRFGDSGGIDSGASDYAFFSHGAQANDTTFSHVGGEDNADAQIELVDTVNVNVGNAAGEGFGGMLYLHRPGDGTSRPTITGAVSFMQTNSTLAGQTVFGMRAAVITLDRVQFLFSGGNVVTGRMTVWGIAHA